MGGCCSWGLPGLLPRRRPHQKLSVPHLASGCAADTEVCWCRGGWGGERTLKVQMEAQGDLGPWRGESLLHTDQGQPPRPQPAA